MRLKIGLILLLLTHLTSEVSAQSLWDRRDPETVGMFQDYRARRVGDVLTVIIEETTGSDAQETRNMDKKTYADWNVNGTGSTSGVSSILRAFGYAVDLNHGAQRTFDGKANTTIDRKFTDRMSFIVVAVLPNGNLIVEGTRHRMITREMRVLRLSGIVRPADIGSNNTVQSYYIADLYINYEGRGPESAYMNQGWGGRIINKLWPN
jgi:flagellar L-ring protein precursor FlgH